MDDGSRSYLLKALLPAIALLLCAFICALTETAVSSVSRIKVKTAADRGDKRAKDVLYILDNFEKAITTNLICTNIAHLFTASVVTTAVTRVYGLSAVTAATLLTTFAVFYFGEMLPKSIAKKYSFSAAKATSGLLIFFMRILTPFSSALSAISERASKRSGQEAEPSVTEDELQDIIEDMTEEGSLDEDQGELISSALQFGDVTAQDILTPRVDMAALDIDSSPEEALKFIKNASHSRIPVYEETVDNIIGILQIRRFIKAYMKDENCEIRPLLDNVYFIKGSTPVDELLPFMSKNRQNIAIVTDQYGGTLGLITVEDILEELVGEIWDEEDIIPPGQSEEGGETA